MIDRGSLLAAADDIVASALLDEGWDGALTRFANLAGARDAVLMRNTQHRTVVAVATEEAAGTVAAFAAGKAPPNSRYEKVKVDPSGGFRIDHDDYTDSALARDPFYQEFLRPAGVFWHANAILSFGPGDYVELSLKRRVGKTPYRREDATALDAALPELRAAARLAKASMDAEVHGMERLLRHRGETIVKLDRCGRVLPGQAMGESDPASPLRIVARRLTATSSIYQAGLDRAVDVALALPGRITLAMLGSPDGRRWFLQIHPLPGRTRDIFRAASAVAVLIERERRPDVPRRSGSELTELFGLTDREADVASLLTEGLEIAAIARELAISPQTTRTYLKYAFEKIGVGRQAELVALLARLAP
jgi:DNA-binding CsgD family transcriptional regulator